MSTVGIDVALAAHHAGLCVVPPVEDGSKAPHGTWKRYQEQRPDEEQLRLWYTNGRSGIGVVCGAVSGGLEMFEFEGRAVAEGVHLQYRDLCEAAGLGELLTRVSRGYCETTPSGGYHLLYRVPTPARSTPLARRPARDDELNDDEKQLRADNPDKVFWRMWIEVKGEGGYTILAPSNGAVHPEGGAWQLVTGDLSTIAEITDEERDELHQLARSLNKDHADRLRDRTKRETREPFASPDDGIKPGDDYNETGDPQKRSLEVLKKHGWVHVYDSGDATYLRRPGKKPPGVSASLGYVAAGYMYVWTTSTEFESEQTYSPFGIYATLEHNGDYADAAAALHEQGYGTAAKRNRESDTKTKPKKQKTKTRGALADGFRGTDVGNADRLVAAADGRIRFVHAWGKWIVYREGRWAVDTGEALVTEAAKQVPRVMIQLAATLSGAARDNLWKWATRSEQSSAVAAMVRLARGVDGVLVDHHQLDADPWLLNVGNGTVDLRTGELRPHNPDDLLTMQAPVIYDPDATASLWEACIERWQPDPELRGYLQRVVGSGIAGAPVERFFVNYGEGANGKSRFFGAVAGVLGPYYVVPHKSLLIVQRHEQHDTVRAKLFRTRMAVGAETDQGARLDEAKIKDLTGGDPLEARRMREDPWQFSPTWTLFLHTNYRPAVRDMTEGTWRRLRLIPWSVTIPENDRDPDLADKLAAERSGVLNWLIAGCLAWQRDGFAEPTAVTAATQEWRGDEDAVGRFIGERCWVHPHAQVAAKAIRGAFEAWCDESGEEPLSATALGAELRRRGFTPDQEKGGKRSRLWKGVALVADSDLGYKSRDVA